MVTIEQIKAAHSKVKSGADFPAYIKDLKQLGITNYETFVNNGHTNYTGIQDENLSSQPMYVELIIADTCRPSLFKTDLKAHQQGKTNYTTFCSDAAKSGIEKWVVNINEMTCTYLDKTGNKILIEQIPNK